MNYFSKFRMVYGYNGMYVELTQPTSLSEIESKSLKMCVKMLNKNGDLKTVKGTTVQTNITTMSVDMMSDRRRNTSNRFTFTVYERIMPVIFNLLYPLRNKPKHFKKMYSMFEYVTMSNDDETLFWTDIDPYYDLPIVLKMLYNRQEEAAIMYNKLELRRKNTSHNYLK